MTSQNALSESCKKDKEWAATRLSLHSSLHLPMSSVRSALADAVLPVLHALQFRSAKRALRATGDASAVAIGRALSSFTSLRDRRSRHWQKRIEGIRSDLMRSEAVLDSWDRPWLDRSEELQERLHLSSDADRVAKEMTVAQAARASKSKAECHLLFNLARELRPALVVELGTNLGISGLYLAAALTEVGAGRLLTLEGSEPKAQVARAHFERLGVSNRVEVIVGDFYDTLPRIITEYGAEIDLAFVDGFHDGPATVNFHEMLVSGMNEGVLVYDDIDWSEGMARAWQRIRSRPRVRLSVQAGAVGICAVGRSAGNVIHL